MKTVQPASIGGYAFKIEEDAYSLCSEYLGRLEKHYGSDQSGKEIMEGIEERMAELLWERCGKDGTVSVENVKEVVSILGDVDQIEKETEDVPPKSNAAAQSSSSRKKLYRNLSDKYVGGVCSGLGAYFGVDTVLLRAVFAIASIVPFFLKYESLWLYVLFPILYVILWICMPGAKTVEQRYALRGESLDVESIRRSVESSRERQTGRSRDFTTGAIKAVAIIFGAALLLVGFAGIMAGGVGLFWGKNLGLGDLARQGLVALSDINPAFVNLTSLTFTRVLGVLAFSLPFILLIYLGCKLLLGFKAPKWHPGLVLLLSWLMVIVALAVMGVMSALGA